MIFSSSLDGTSKIWSLSYPSCIKVISNDQTPVKSQLNLDNKSIWMTKNNSTILRSLDTNEVIKEITGHSANVNVIINYKDLIITGSDDATIRLYDKLSSKTLRTLVEHDGPIKFLKIIQNNKYKYNMLASADSFQLKLW